MSAIQETTFESTMSLIKQLDAHDLTKLLKAVIAELGKKVTGSKTTKKTGSMPKGVVPPQLMKPRAWVDFTLKHAQENGWESFTVHQSKKDKETGETNEMEIEMPASIEVEGRHIFPDSVDEKNPQGKTLIHKDAMSLSKHYWAPKMNEGAREDLYEEFLAQYEASDSESEEPVKKNKESEKEEKKRVKEEEKAAKAAEKEAEKAAKLAEKEEKAAAKEAEKAAKAAEKAKKEKKPATTPVATPVKVTKAVPQAPLKAAKAATTWSCPADGQLHRWTFKGEAMLRNSDNEVWKAASDGLGEWMGIYDPKTGKFDDSAEEPQFDE